MRIRISVFCDDHPQRRRAGPLRILRRTNEFKKRLAWCRKPRAQPV